MSDSTTIQSKVCRTCGKEFPATREYFHPGSYADKLTADCKLCINYRRRTDPRIIKQTKDRKAKYNAAHRRENAEYSRRFRRQHPEQSRAAQQKRLSRDLSVLSYFPEEHWEFCLDYWNGCCAYCGNPPGLWNRITRDHFIPVSHPDYPGTVIVNILPACRDCNTNKNNSDASEWLVRRFGYKRGNVILASILEYFSIVRRTIGTPKVIFELENS